MPALYMFEEILKLYILREMQTFSHTEKRN